MAGLNLHQRRGLNFAGPGDHGWAAGIEGASFKSDGLVTVRVTEPP